MIFSTSEGIRTTNSITVGMSLTKPVETPAHQMPGSLEIINANSRTAPLQGEGFVFWSYVYVKALVCQQDIYFLLDHSESSA